MVDYNDSVVSVNNPHALARGFGVRVVLYGRGNVLDVSYSGFTSPFLGGGDRGEIMGFSQASRRRLIRLLATLDRDQVNVNGELPKFITLTTSKVFEPLELKQILKDKFFKWIKWRFPAVSAVWRMEFQKRGAPHFHLLVFGLPFVDFDELRKVWGRMVDEVSPFVRIEALRSFNGVMFYVSKYVAKVDTSSLLDYGAYSESVGRFWGVFNRAGLPIGSGRVVTLPAGGWVYKFLDACREKWGEVPADMTSFTLYADEVDKYFDLALQFCAGDGLKDGK